MALMSTGKSDVVVLSHLRWDFVLQRPQHLMNHLSKHRRILFIEEPLSSSEIETPQLTKVGRQIWVLQIPASRIGSAAYFAAVAQALQKLGISLPIIWTYSPAFLNIIKRIPRSLVVYDCMDQLTAFKHAPAHLGEQEEALLQVADVVFTGGQSLYELKSRQHANVFCFPSSVERKHFEKAAARRLNVPADMAAIPHPIIGFYGVLDERINVKLLNQLALRMPQTSFVLIGPVVKIDPLTLPKADNIFYLGMKQYQALAGYLQEFDVAFMPFALNRSTRFISPTKTLEFMAAHKPIVSTPITDVVSAYAHIVKIAATPAAMETAIQAFLVESKRQRQKRIQAEETVLAQSSWEYTAAAMDQVMEQAAADNSVIDEARSFSWEVSHVS